MEPDQFKKEEKKVVLMKEKIPFYLSKFEKVVTENRGFSVGGAVSVYESINEKFYDIND
jgi:glutathione S-transferase